MSTPAQRAAPDLPVPATPVDGPAPDPGGHLPLVAEGEGCLEILSERLRSSPGVVAIEANFRVTADRGRVGLSRRVVPADSAELVRPLARAKPWGATLSTSEQEQLARGRAMVSLTAACFVLLAIGIVLERTALPAVWHHVAFTLSAIAGGWFALRSSLRSLA